MSKRVETERVGKDRIWLGMGKGLTAGMVGKTIGRGVVSILEEAKARTEAGSCR